MKLIIAGSRSITNLDAVTQGFVLSGFDVTQIEEIVSGMAPEGVDQLAVTLADILGIKLQPMPAAWRDRDGVKDPQAGFRRNVQMARYVGPTGGLLAIWDGESNGTEHMIRSANAKKLRVYIHKVTP